MTFKIYVDTERFLKRINIDEGKYTKLYQKHTPNSIGAKLVCIDDRFTLDTIIFEGKDCINKFIKWIFRMQKYCNQIINNYFNKKLKMTIYDEERYQNLQIRWICNEKINKDKDKEIDHCHITGKCRGAAHKKCNLKLEIQENYQLFFIIWKDMMDI